MVKVKCMCNNKWIDHKTFFGYNGKKSTALLLNSSKFLDISPHLQLWFYVSIANKWCDHSGPSLEVLHYLLTLTSVTNPLVYIIFNEDLVMLIKSWVTNLCARKKRWGKHSQGSCDILFVVGRTLQLIQAFLVLEICHKSNWILGGRWDSKRRIQKMSTTFNYHSIVHIVSVCLFVCLLK